MWAVTDRLAKLMPDADRLTIAGATHNMFNSHPAEFNAGVLRFIRSHSVADRRPGPSSSCNETFTARRRAIRAEGSVK